ncbi:MAG TPA: hypothetical protein VGR56_09690 [Nitrososphaerales archaeon]|nr:hypothetical protein [Nitrososphaerales archaeon]
MSTQAPQVTVSDWERINFKMKVVKLSWPVQLLVPALIFPSLSKGTRGLTLYPGRMGLALGSLLAASSLIIGVLLLGPMGLLGAILTLWLLGTAGVATVVGSFRPMAFIKPICTRCRHLPIIKEHEAIHLSGVASESRVWASMRTRHSSKSLSLEGDPSICTFCPIPKRISEH